MFVAVVGIAGFFVAVFVLISWLMTNKEEL